MRQAILLKVAGCLLGLTVLAGCSVGEPPATPTPLPTATPQSTSTPTPTSTATATQTTEPTATAVPTATPIPASPTPTVKALVLVGTNNYTNSIGNPVVVGVYQYNGSKPGGMPEISVSLRDKDGKLVAAQKAFSVPSLIKPNTVIPFNVLFFDYAGDWETYDVEIQVPPLSTFMPDLFYADFQVEEANLVPGGRFSNGPKITGVVRNVGSRIGTNVLAYGAVYDKDGKVLDVNTGLATISNLAPGQSSPFEISFDASEGAVRYDIVVTAITGQ